MGLVKKRNFSCKTSLSLSIVYYKEARNIPTNFQVGKYPQSPDLTTMKR